MRRALAALALLLCVGCAGLRTRPAGETGSGGGVYLGMAGLHPEWFEGQAAPPSSGSRWTTLAFGSAGAEFDGSLVGYTTVGTGVSLGVVSFPGVWLSGAGTALSTSNYAIMNAGSLLVNGPSGQGLGFRENNTNVLGTWTSAAGLSIGTSGTAIKQANEGSGTLDFASAAAGACSADLTITVTGATVTAAATVSPINASVPAGSIFFAWVSAADTVKVRHCCINGTCDPASGVYHARTFNP